MQCDACGATIGATARFCEQCGSPVATGGAAGTRGRISPRPEHHGDRRIVSAMFADLVDYVRMVAELDPEDVQERVSHALSAMAAAVERFGGTREKFIGDAIFAVFGWPTARDDDAVRATLCALAIRSALSDLPGHPFEVRIGISTGEVVARRGSGPLDENQLTGPAIVTAARIQSLARAGEIVVDAATVEAARSRVGVTDRGTVILRGHAEPVHLFAVEHATGFDTWVRPRVRRRTPLVGRVAELRILAEAIDRCADERAGSTVLVEGEPGIGKSRLLAEAEPLARAAGLGWTWTENVSYGVLEPYRFARVLAQALADEHGVDSGQYARRMLFTPGMDPSVVQRFGGAIAAIAREADFGGWETEASHMPDDPAEVAATLTEVADQYIRRVLETGGPRVIVIDDLHWIDQSSAAMADLLVERTATHPLLVFAAQRPGPQPAWAADGHVRRLRLGGLQARESGQLATNVARAALDADGARQIHERTGGNPLFVTETVRAFLADGTLAVHDGRLRLVHRGEPSVPVTLRAVLGARIDALGQEARELLGVAAVIGMRFRTGMAERLVDLELGASAIRELAESALIVPVEGDVWRFGHALIRDTAYSGLLASRRRELHGRVADELEREDPAPPLARIARHRAAAGDRDRALPLLVRAADMALGVGAISEAAGFWREAAELTTDPEAAHAYRRRAAEVVAGVGTSGSRG